MPLLEARGLRRGYDGRAVLDVEQLTLDAQEVLAVLGPNGSGKSTLFRLLLMLEAPDTGTITLGGAPLTARLARQRMAGVFQRPYLFAGSVTDNVCYGLRRRGLDRRQQRAQAETVLADLGLNAVADRSVQQLSGGEMQRVALARALACQTDIVLFDEPTSALDVTAQRAFREDLARVVRARKLSVILITHDPGDAFALADRIAVLEGGRVVQSGTPMELLTQPQTPFVAEFTGAELLLDGVVEEVVEGLVGVRLNTGCLIWVAHAAQHEIGAAVHVSYQPDDVALSPADSAFESSAQNVFTLEVERITLSGPLVRVVMNGDARLAAVITRRGADQLGIRPGARVHAHLKAAALRAFAAAGS